MVTVGYNPSTGKALMGPGETLCLGCCRHITEGYPCEMCVDSKTANQCRVTIDGITPHQDDCMFMHDGFYYSYYIRDVADLCGSWVIPQKYAQGCIWENLNLLNGPVGYLDQYSGYDTCCTSTIVQTIAMGGVSIIVQILSLSLGARIKVDLYSGAVLACHWTFQYDCPDNINCYDGIYTKELFQLVYESRPYIDPKDCYSGGSLYSGTPTIELRFG